MAVTNCIPAHPRLIVSTSTAMLIKSQKKHLNSALRFIDVNLRTDSVAKLMTFNIESQRKLVLDFRFILKNGLLAMLEQKYPYYYNTAVVQDDIYFFPDLVADQRALRKLLTLQGM